MYKILVPFILICSYVQAQSTNDTIFLDYANEKTNKKNAISYLLNTNSQQKALYNLKTNEISMEGEAVLQNNSPLKWIGKVKGYAPGKVLSNTYTYDNQGQLTHIESYNPITKETYQAEFIDNYQMEGKASYIEQDLLTYMENKNGSIQYLSYINLKEPLNKLVNLFEDDMAIETKYFDKDGKNIYSCDYKDGYPFNGQYVSLYPTSLNIEGVQTYLEGQEIEMKNYYKDGALLSKAIESPAYLITVYYDKQGREIGQFTYDNINEKLHGDQFFFDSEYYGEKLGSKYTYTDGYLSSSVSYNTKIASNPVKMISYYNLESALDSVQYFDTKGELISTVTYKDYEPYNGTMYEDNYIDTYLDGKLTYQKFFYPQTTKVFEIYQDNVSQFFDYQQNIIGTLTYDPEDSYYLTPKQGVSYNLDDNAIYQKNTYKNNKLIEQTDYYACDNPKDKLSIYSTTKFPEDDQGLKTITYYYANGNLREQSTYYQSQFMEDELIQADYYDSNKNKIGSYDKQNKGGQIITFSTNNIITDLKKYVDQQLVYHQSYLPTLENTWVDPIDLEQSDYFLQKQIDFNSQGVFYDFNQENKSVVVYKDQAPFQGEVWEIEYGNITKTPYKQGQIDGVQLVLPYLDYDMYYTKDHYSKGELLKEEKYFEDILLEQTVYENNEPILHLTNSTQGELLTKMQYKNGLPFEGNIKQENYYLTYYITYKNGQIQQVDYMDYLENIIAQDIFIDQSTYERTVFDEQQKQIIQYRVKDNFINGELKYFDNGKVSHTAFLEDGQLIKGTINLEINTSQHNNYDTQDYPYSDNYFQISRNKNKVSLLALNKATGEVISDMQVKLTNKDILLTPLPLSAITPEDLYVNSDYYTYIYVYSHEEILSFN